MKRFFKVTGYIFLGALVCLYLAFLFVIPRKIDLNVYKSDIQKLVKEYTALNVDFDRVDVITSPFLEAGIKTKNISVKLPDDSVLFSADSFKGKVFLPSLLWLSVRVSCAEVESPNLNVEIINGEKFKVGKVYEDLVNKQREQRRLNPQKEEENSFPIDPSVIKFVMPNLQLDNYKAVIDDTKSSHKLTLKGEQLKLGYFNGKFAKLKTNAEFLSDNDKNITANLDIVSVLPKFTPTETEEDDDGVFELPFVNPVTIYRDYNLKSDINSKLKISKSNKKDSKIFAKGFLNIDNTTVTLAGMELPKSYFNLEAKGYQATVDTNLYVTDKEYLNLFGIFNYGKHPFVDMTLKSPQVHFNNILNIARAYLDTIHFKNDIANMSADGYLLSNFRLKTDFKTITSNGKFVIRGGDIYHKNIGLVFNNINANLLFDDNIFRIDDTHLLINKKPLNISGKIDADSVANFDITADKIPLSGLYLAFAPKELKNFYNLSSGFLTLNAKVKGEIKEVASLFKADLDDFNFSDKAGNFMISNKSARFGFASAGGEIRGKLSNQGFALNLPNLNSTVSDDLVVANLDNKNIKINESDIRFNKKSIVKFDGEISDYLSNPDTKISANGYLSDTDLKTLVGEQGAGYLDSLGAIPVKFAFNSKGKSMDARAQLLASPTAYITPVTISDFVGKQLLLQVFAQKNGDTLKLKKTGLFIRKADTPFNENLALNTLNTKEAISVKAMISNLSTNPFISLFRVSIPKDLDGSICIFKKSKFTFGGNLFAFGKLATPTIKGNFYLRNLSIPEILTTIRNIDANVSSKDVTVAIKDVDANGSDFNINVRSTFNQLAKMELGTVNLVSKLMDADKLLVVSESLMKTLPSVESTGAVSSEPADIPVEILDGTINIRKITTGNMVVENTTSKIALLKNIFYLKGLKTHPLGGYVDGDASMNLLTYEMKAKVQGKDFDVEKVLYDTMQMQDMVSGTMKFIADISLKGLDVEEQMKTLKGYVDFSIKNGQLGPFGKFENFLMAENIRENAFFSSTIGSIIKNVVTFDTSRFNTLYGSLNFENGVANIAPIKSQGNVMSMYIAGKVGLLDNSADLKVRGKLASVFSDSLGPLANINPVNLIKNTPGLNIVAAKTFSIFCEQISEEEMKALPPLGEGKSDDYATKFQIVLRGDTRKPLKMIKSFKWLALNSEIESAQSFVDTFPIPEEGEENLSVEELIKLREEQAQQAAAEEATKTQEKSNIFSKLLEKIKK